jgi:hypothetical protein
MPQRRTLARLLKRDPGVGWLLVIIIIAAGESEAKCDESQ